MKYLINPTSADGARSGCIPFCTNQESCPYLCITKCPTKVEQCTRPIGAGLSPTSLHEKK